MQTKNGKEVKKEERDILFAPKGMHDILPRDWPWWKRVYDVAEDLAHFYNFGRIETPVLEQAELFHKGVGNATDVVDKEMYTLKTKGGDYLALRPEGTAPIVRAYVEHRLSKTNPFQKLWYREPMFRHERPQAGRFRQFHQIGFEVLGGVSDPLYDAQIMLIFWRLLSELKIKRPVLKINSIGCRICRPIYLKQLQAYYKSHEKEICKDCTERLTTNPLRVLDCKNPECQPIKAKAPNFFNKLCTTCSAHFSAVLEYLDELKIPYTLDNFLVRGLDYYSRTVFEMYVEGVGEELKALPAGGRYDYLFEMLGNRPTPAVGAAVGVERLIGVMKAQEIILPPKKEKRVFVIHVGDRAKKKMLSVMEVLRDAGIPISEALSRESLSAQLKMANKEGMKVALILGQKEVFENSIIVRDLEGSTQDSVPMAKMLEEIKKKLK